MKAVALYRVSTNEIKQSNGIGVQRHDVRSFAASNGVEIIEEVEEMGSGRKTDRPTLQKDLAACRKHKAILLVSKPCRLTRSVELLQTIINSDVEVVIAQFGLGAQNKMLLNLMTMIYEFEAETISSRTKAALQELKRRNEHNPSFKLGAPPQALIIAQQKAAIARRKKGDETHSRYFDLISSFRNQGWGYQRIANKLTEMGVLTPRKAAKWSGASVRNIYLR